MNNNNNNSNFNYFMIDKHKKRSRNNELDNICIKQTFSCEDGSEYYKESKMKSENYSLIKENEKVVDEFILEENIHGFSEELED